MPFGLRDEVIEKVHQLFSKHPQVEQVILYGSRALGRERPGSDIDLAFKGEAMNLPLLLTLADELDDLLLPWQFDLSLYRDIENPDLRDHIDRVGVLFYKKKQSPQE